MPLRPILLVALAAITTACSQQDKKPRLPLTAVVGIWRSDPTMLADSIPTVFELRTTAAGMAELVATRVGRDSVSARGTWDGADSLLRVLVRQDTGVPRPTSILFVMRGNALTPQTYAGPTIGPESLARGMRLVRR